MRTATITALPSSKLDAPLYSDEFRSLRKQHGAVRAFAFGSAVFGALTESSDLDILVEFVPKIGLLEQIGLSLDLAKVAGRPVDLVTNIHPAFTVFIEPTLVPIPL